MLVTSKRSMHLHNLPTSITIGNAQIPFKQSVKNLGFTLDCHLTMNAHVSNIARTCYFELRRLAYIRRFLTSTATATLVIVIITIIIIIIIIFVLALLDLSSAFDTIDHSIHVQRLHTDFGITVAVLQWYSSYLTDRTRYVSLSNHCSAFAHAHSGVLQGPVLGHMLFTMYAKPLSAIINSHSIIHHSFADDLQLQMSAPHDKISELLHSMQLCIGNVIAWTTANMLKLKDRTHACHLQKN